MTKGGRVAGGTIAIAGGALATVMLMPVLLINLISAMFQMGMTPGVPALNAFGYIMYFLYIAGCCLGLVGGILLIKDKNMGSILALIGGSLATVLLVINQLTNLVEVSDTAMIVVIILVAFCLPIVGGVIGLAVGSKS